MKDLPSPVLGTKFISDRSWITHVGRTDRCVRVRMDGEVEGWVDRVLLCASLSGRMVVGRWLGGRKGVGTGR